MPRMHIRAAAQKKDSDKKIKKEEQKMQFIEYPKCTTCQKAKKWLQERNAVFSERNIKTENPTKEELAQWYRESALPLKRFFNTSGLLYKEMGLKDKLPDMSEEEQLALLATDGMLVKRPIVAGDGGRKFCAGIDVNDETILLK